VREWQAIAGVGQKSLRIWPVPSAGTAPFVIFVKGAGFSSKREWT